MSKTPHDPNEHGKDRPHQTRKEIHKTKRKIRGRKTTNTTRITHHLTQPGRPRETQNRIRPHKPQIQKHNKRIDYDHRMASQHGATTQSSTDGHMPRNDEIVQTNKTKRNRETHTIWHTSTPEWAGGTTQVDKTKRRTPEITLQDTEIQIWTKIQQAAHTGLIQSYPLGQ